MFKASAICLSGISGGSKLPITEPGGRPRRVDRGRFDRDNGVIVFGQFLEPGGLPRRLGNVELSCGLDVPLLGVLKTEASGLANSSD